MKVLQPLISIPNSTRPSRIPTVSKSSTSTQAHLLPSTSSVAVTTSPESHSPIPLIDIAPTTSNSLYTSVVPSFLSNKTLSSSTGSMFSPSPAETSPVPETSTTSNTIPSTSQAPQKKNDKNSHESVLTNLLPHSHTLTHLNQKKKLI
ncbi:hypothetical protein TNCV_4677331 [Trichonephila clavipes]|nr:hypothetical protein TNCV_4677331 [Trichonephila clavipes]